MKQLLMRSYFMTGIWAMLLVGGCCSSSLPDGNPPDGDIVQAAPISTTLSPAAASNYFATSMTAALLKHFPPGSIIIYRKNFHAPSAYASMAESVLRNSGDLFVFRETASGDNCRISSSICRIGNNPDYVWTMEFQRNGEVLWKDSLLLENNEKKTDRSRFQQKSGLQK